jgi:hypothetical protein
MKLLVRMRAIGFYVTSAANENSMASAYAAVPVLATMCAEPTMETNAQLQPATHRIALMPLHEVTGLFWKCRSAFARARASHG